MLNDYGNYDMYFFSVNVTTHYSSLLTTLLQRSFPINLLGIAHIQLCTQLYCIIDSDTSWLCQ